MVNQLVNAIKYLERRGVKSPTPGLLNQLGEVIPLSEPSSAINAGITLLQLKQ